MTIIVQPFTNVLLWIYSVLGQNFGLAIIVFTALIRLITLPLTYRQMKSSMVMAEIQKSERYQKIQKKYKDNRQKQSEEQMKLYRELGYNPFGGCLGLLIQFPIIIGLYQTIIRSMASTPSQLFGLTNLLYSRATTSLIPLNSEFLWMNLGQPERLAVSFLPIEIPVLTIIVVISTWLQTKLTTPTASPDQQGAGMSQMMSIYMPLLLGYFAYTLASGLALYFVVSNILGIVQGLVMRRARASKAT